MTIPWHRILSNADCFYWLTRNITIDSVVYRERLSWFVTKKYGIQKEILYWSMKLPWKICQTWLNDAKWREKWTKSFFAFANKKLNFTIQGYLRLCTIYAAFNKRCSVGYGIWNSLYYHFNSKRQHLPEWRYWIEARG